MKQAHNLNDEDIRIIYSAHSLPKPIAPKGDKYNEECKVYERIEKVLQDSGLKHHGALAWQSKVGPQRTKWLAPSTPDVIAETKQGNFDGTYRIYHGSLSKLLTKLILSSGAMPMKL